MPTEHFKSKEAYRKNLAYRHMHGIPFTAKDVVVGGKEHAVKHSTNPEREKIDAKQKRKVADEPVRKMDTESSTYNWRNHIGRGKKGNWAR